MSREIVSAFANLGHNILLSKHVAFSLIKKMMDVNPALCTKEMCYEILEFVVFQKDDIFDNKLFSRAIDERNYTAIKYLDSFIMKNENLFSSREIKSMGDEVYATFDPEMYSFFFEYGINLTFRDISELCQKKSTENINLVFEFYDIQDPMKTSSVRFLNNLKDLVHTLLILNHYKHLSLLYEKTKILFTEEFKHDIITELMDDKSIEYLEDLFQM